MVLAMVSEHEALNLVSVEHAVEIAIDADAPPAAGRHSSEGESTVVVSVSWS
jgi:hypothetical protein